MTRTELFLDPSCLSAFVHLTRDRNFTSVARRMGVTPSAVSKAIARLEGEIGATLVIRNSRCVSLTAEGILFQSRCRQLLSTLEEAKREIGNAGVEPSGQLHVSLPEGFGRVVIAPRLSEFVARHPQVGIELLFTDQRLEFVDSNLDIALWTGPLPKCRLIARRLPALKYVTCASPGYLAKHGVPRSVDELNRHARLGAIAKRTGQLQPWRFMADGILVEHPCKPKIQSDSVHALVSLAVDGVGIAQVTEYSARDAISRGLLVPVLEEYSGPGTALNLVYPTHARSLNRVKAFVDFVVGAVGEWQKAVTGRPARGATKAIRT